MKSESSHSPLDAGSITTLIVEQQDIDKVKYQMADSMQFFKAISCTIPDYGTYDEHYSNMVQAYELLGQILSADRIKVKKHER